MGNQWLISYKLWAGGNGRLLDGGQRKTTSSICLRNSRFYMTQALKLKFTAKQTTLLLLLCSALAHLLAPLHNHCAHTLWLFHLSSARRLMFEMFIIAAKHGIETQTSSPPRRYVYKEILWSDEQRIHRWMLGWWWALKPCWAGVALTDQERDGKFVQLK